MSVKDSTAQLTSREQESKRARERESEIASVEKGLRGFLIAFIFMHILFIFNNYILFFLHYGAWVGAVCCRCVAMKMQQASDERMCAPAGVGQKRVRASERERAG